MARWEKFAAQVAAKKRRVATLATGWLTDRATNWAFEYVLYPVVILRFGLIQGSLIMIVLSIVSSLVLIKLYDYLKVDWLGIEAVKDCRDGEEFKSFFGRIVQWAMRKGDIVALLALSIYSEPVKVTLYMRHGANQFNGFSRRDWLIFTTAVVIGNVTWALTVWGGLEVLRNFL